MTVRPIDGNDFVRRLTLDTSKGHYGEFMDGSEVAFTSREIAAFVEQMPTLTPPNEWVSVEERLPENDGWYLVYAPGYWGNSTIYGLDGLAYSNFKHNYKVHWGIERGTGRGWPGIVTHWMLLPAPPAKGGDR